MVAGSLQLVVAALERMERDGCQSPLCPLYDSILELHQDCLSLLSVAEDDEDSSRLLVGEPGCEDLLGRAIRVATALLPMGGSAVSTHLLRDVLRYLRVVWVLRPLHEGSASRRAGIGPPRAEAAMSRRWDAINLSYASVLQ